MPPNRKVITLVFPGYNSLRQQIIEGVVDHQLGSRKWTLIELPRNTPGESPFKHADVRPDGIITWLEARDTWITEFANQGIPIINCGAEWVGHPGIVSVHFDYEEIQQTVIEHFKALGFKRLVIIGHLFHKRPKTLRVLNQIVQYANHSGLESILWELDGPDSPSVSPQRLLAPEKETALADFLKRIEKPTAVWTYADHLGYIVASVAKRLSIDVPRELAICGFGNFQVSSFADPPLTTIVGAERQVGQVAAQCLDHWFEHGAPPFFHKTVPNAKLIQRESTVGGSGSIVLEAVRRTIETHSRSALTLDQLVTLSGLSVKTLVRRYRECFGIDPTDDIHLHRTQAAKQLLNHSDRSISDVALACAFSSQAAFANYFQRHVGMSPSEYRKQAANRQ